MLWQQVTAVEVSYVQIDLVHLTCWTLVQRCFSVKCQTLLGMFWALFAATLCSHVPKYTSDSKQVCSGLLCVARQWHTCVCPALVPQALSGCARPCLVLTVAHLCSLDTAFATVGALYKAMYGWQLRCSSECEDQVKLCTVLC